MVAAISLLPISAPAQTDLVKLERDLGEKVGVDLWNYETRDGRSIRKALEFLQPFASGEKKWPYQQLGDWPAQISLPVFPRKSK